MELDIEFLLVLALWAVGLFLLIWAAWKGRLPTAGLVLGYFLQLGLIHGLAGFLQLVPGPVSPNRELTLTGFKVTGFAVVGLVLGALVVAPWVYHAFFAPGAAPPGRSIGAEGLVNSYILVGLACFLSLAFPWARIPGASALLSAGLPIAVAGFSLRWWVHWHAGRFDQANLTLLLLPIVPLVILLTQGFLGYGVSAVLSCLSFVAVYYRPRWAVLLVGGICCAVGLLVFPVYMAAREQIREAVWGGASISDRLSVTADSIVTRWQWLDQEDPSAFLDPVDRRLNQNYLLGAAVQHMEATGEYFVQGETIWQAVLAMIPRILWPEKPVFAGSGDLVTRFTGITFAQGTSVGIGHFLELYVNFGKPGLFLGTLVLGLFLGVLDCACGSHLRAGKLHSFTLCFVVGLIFHNVIGNFAEATAATLGGIGLCLLIQHLLPAGAGVVRPGRPQVPMGAGR